MPRSRAKGVSFEREVAAALESVGDVRGLESGGDHFVISRNGGRPLHVEAKRQERLQLHIWLRQQERDCPPGCDRVLVFRRNREPAYAVLPFADYLTLIGGEHE